MDLGIALRARCRQQTSAALSTLRADARAQAYRAPGGAVLHPTLPRWRPAAEDALSLKALCGQQPCATAHIGRETAL